ncbi:receptor-type tyrosine-protein phosphatase eta-like, partial [Polypterus senegalus]|uniref:receptor-type tyrosine-protein phosphatase eta-like n=1 Tax=Polypterus senegalus TaxID=55291 RepID=UPI0019664C92
NIPIKVENYGDYYHKHCADQNYGFALQFENFKTVGTTQPKTAALCSENHGKNRYKNVLPYDEFRVKLSTEGNLSEDYINASYLPGYNSKKEFIGTQGPLPSTVKDFWRMIWEQNVETLVMLTRCKKKGKVCVHRF